MALIYLLSAFALGATAVRHIRFPVYAFEGVALAVVIGLFGWTWLTFLIELVLPYDLSLAIVVMVCAIATLVLWPSGATPPMRPLEGGRRSWIVWGVVSLGITILMARIFWTHMLPQDAQGIWSAGSTWGDYGLHATFISHINSVGKLPMDLPVAAGEKMTYPFLIDLLSAMYVHGGMSLHIALFVPGVLLTLSICQLMISLGLRLFGRISVGVGTLGLALTIGSAAGTWTAWQDWRKSGEGLFKFLGHIPDDYSILGGKNVNVSNLLTDALLPQRSFLFGMSVGLIVLILFQVSRERKDTKLLWPAAILVGLLPMAHPHTFIMSCTVFLALTLEAAWQTKKAPLAFIKPFALALVIALPQVLWQQYANNNGSGGHFKLFWEHQQGQSLLFYYWGNFGLVGIALLAVPFIFRKDKQQLFWFMPMLFLLFITQIYAFQPTEYDNLKLIYWVYIMGFFYLTYAIGNLVRKRRAWLALVLPLGAFVVIPGVLSIARDMQLHYNFESPVDIQVADWISKNTPPDSVWATISNPNPPVSTLAGRTLVDGYSGWLYNFSIPYAERDAAVKAALNGNFQDPLLKKFGTDYLLVSTNEDPAWPVNRAALANLPVLYVQGPWQIYKLNP